MTTAARRTDVNKAALLDNLDFRLWEADEERRAGEITREEYERARDILLAQVEAILALPG